MQLSVIICTHNPPANRLQRILAALKNQTLALNEWELILIDNASEQFLERTADLRWHPNSRVIREEKLGLTPARLAGISATRTELLVFVDDDNEVDQFYLSAALELFSARPDLGACSGNAIAEFELEPPHWVQNYLPFLGIRRVDTPMFTKEYFDWGAMPIGAGLCVRREIAIAYAESCQRSSSRQRLGRKGRSLTSGEDSDLAMTAIDLGFLVGLTPTLSLRHLIPSERCSEEYVVRLMEGITFSGLMLQSIRGVDGAPPARNSMRTLASNVKAALTLKGVDRKVYFAKRRGEATFRSLTNQDT